jgi:hypothetical protein
MAYGESSHASVLHFNLYHHNCPYAGLLNAVANGLAVHMLVSMHLLGSALWETERSKYFLLHTRSFRCSVMMKTAITLQSITVLI